MSLLPGTRFGPHEVVVPLGAGGMGDVYLAHDTRLDRDVALKVLPPSLAEDAEAIARFRHEALTLASLNHPNIATVYGFEESPDGTMALVLERVEGETLAERLRSGALPARDALQIGSQIAQALEVAHERGIIHRDVKPANVMIGPRGLVKVLDFGLASRIAGIERLRTRPHRQPSSELDAPTMAIASPEPSTDSSGLTVGTPGYMSPEQVVARPLDERTDVFALGCVLFECLAGARAFSGSTALETMTLTLERPADLSLLPERGNAAVRTLVERCLAKDKEQRPRSMHDVRLELESALGIRHAAGREAARIARHNLPAPVSAFVGREAVLAECGRVLERARSLSLVGMGGSGKTRLALQLAESRLDAFPNGVWFVDVAPLVEAERVVEVLAAALQVREEPGRSLLDAITRELASRPALVLMDNAETHPRECARLAGHLLAACRDLKVLVTSREPLGIDGETVYTVPAFGTPKPGTATAAEASVSEAVQLFCERAQAASPGFELSDDNVSAVVEICRRLDGIPLALELAAARVRLLSVEQIRSRLGDRFKLLARDGGVLSRQQTMRATIQWSWDSLKPPEQDLMRRLAVFHGGWTLERAVEVCSESGDEFEMLDLLTRLAERLLVVVDRGADGSVRYRFLETVWRFGLEKLEADAGYEALRDRHFASFLAMAERAEGRLVGPGHTAQMSELAREEENLVAALAWTPRVPDGVLRGLRLAAAAQRVWSALGRYAVGRRVIEEVLARDATRAPTPERAKALVRAAGFMLTMGDYEVARPHLEESLALSQTLGDRRGTARAVSGLGVVALYQGRLEDAIACTEQGLAIYSELGEVRGEAMALHNLGTLESSRNQGDHGRARYEAALARFRQIGDVTTEALCLSALAVSLVRLGEGETARQRLIECVSSLEGMAAPREAVFALEATMEWLFARDRAAEAARLGGVAERARKALELPHSPIEKADYERLLARMTERVGIAQADRARAAGGALTLEQGVAEARALLNAPSTP